MKYKSIFLIVIVFTLFFINLSYFSASNSRLQTKDSSSFQASINTSHYSVDFSTLENDGFVFFSSKDRYIKFRPNEIISEGNTQLKPNFDSIKQSGYELDVENVFGNGIDLKYIVEDTRLKEKIILLERSALPPKTGDTRDLKFDFLLEYSADILPKINNVSWNGTPINASGDITFIRKKDSHRLYLINRFFILESPSVIDANGRQLFLNYTLRNLTDGVHLTIILPQNWLDSAEFPVYIDPTVEVDEDRGYDWQNENNCSTAPSDCEDYDPAGSTLEFYISDSCSTGDRVDKPIFEFNISSLRDYYDYENTLDSAYLHVKGYCTNEGDVPIGYYVRLYEIGNFSTPTCGDEIDSNVIGTYIDTLMSRNTCDVEGEKDIDIKTRLEDRLSDNDDFMAFKIDIYPELDYNDEPSNQYGYRFPVGYLEIRYSFTCTDSSHCRSGEYCNSTGYCTEQLDDGDDCYEVEYTNESDNACEGGHCRFDNYDGQGWFCAEDNECVNNGEDYDSGYELCNDSDFYKECQSGGSWGGFQYCHYNCSSGISGGCPPWWPSYWSELNETLRNDSHVEYEQHFKWNSTHLDNLKALSAFFQWELRRNQTPDAWDYWEDTNIPWCKGSYWTNLPLATHIFSEESDLSYISSVFCRNLIQSSWHAEEGNEEFEVKSYGSPLFLKENKTYFVTVRLNRKNKNNNISIKSESEFCGFAPGCKDIKYGFPKINMSDLEFDLTLYQHFDWHVMSEKNVTS